MDFQGPNIVLNFHVDWFGSFRSTLMRDRRQTDRQADGNRHCIRPHRLRGVGA